MQFPVKLIVQMNMGGQLNAFFETQEAGQKVLNDFAERLKSIKEFSNRDEDPIFRFDGYGAFYAVDLRKAMSASLELREKWRAVSVESNVEHLKTSKSIRSAAVDAGLGEELERHETLDLKMKSAAA